MTPRGNTQYRYHFRFSVVSLFIFLLTSPTRVSSDAKSCAAVTLTLNGFQEKFPLGKDTQFVRQLTDCLNGAKKTYSEIQGGIIKQLAEVIHKVLPVARTDGLVLLSVYLLYRSYVLYDETKILGENVRIYRDKFEALEKEMKPFRDFIDNELIPQWKKDNTAHLQKIAANLLQKTGNHSTVLQELTQAIRRDIEKGGSSQKCGWPIVTAAGGFFLCVGSLVARPTPNAVHATPPSSSAVGDASFTWVSVPTCVAFIGTAGYSWFCYSSLRDTLRELEKLEKDTTIMGQEIKRYQSQLESISGAKIISSPCMLPVLTVLAGCAMLPVLTVLADCATLKFILMFRYTH